MLNSIEEYYYFIGQIGNMTKSLISFCIYFIIIILIFLISGLSMDYCWKKYLVKNGHAQYNQQTGQFELKEIRQ